MPTKVHWQRAIDLDAKPPLSFWSRARRAHLALFAVVGWLVGFGYVAGGYPSEPGFQNEILTGLVLLLFAFIPTDANEPPRAWREFLAERAEARETDG